MLWLVRSAAPDDRSGHLDKLDASTGQTLGSWEVGATPVAVAAAADVWVVDGAGPATPGSVLRLDSGGHQLNRYDISGPVSIATDGNNGAWVGSVSGDRAQLSHIGITQAATPLTLPGTALGGTLPLARCPEGVFAATASTSGQQMSILSATADGAVRQIASLPGRGTITIGCQGQGLIVTQAADATRVTRLTTSGTVIATQVEPSRTAKVSQSDAYTWLLLASPTPDHTLLTLIRPDNLAHTSSIDVDGDSVAVATEARRLWTIQANTSDNRSTIDVLEY